MLNKNLKACSGVYSYNGQDLVKLYSIDYNKAIVSYCSESLLL